MIRVRGIPLYWAFEEDPQDRALLTGSWVVEDSIPFRASTYGVRIRVSQHHWLHVGLFRYRREALHLGLSYRPTEIGKWTPTNAETQGDGATATIQWDFQAGTVTDPGSGASAGDIPQQDGGTVSWYHTQGTGPGLAAAGDGSPDPPSP